MARDSVATLWNNWLLQNKFNAHVYVYMSPVPFWWQNLRHVHCTLSLTYAEKEKFHELKKTKFPFGI